MSYHRHNTITTEILDQIGNVNLVNHLKPLNLKQEREIFFTKKHNYNPQFVYPREQVRTPDEVALFVKQRVIPEDEEGKLLRDKLHELKLKLELVHLHNNPGKFSEVSTQIFGRPEQKYVEIASKMAKSPKAGMLHALSIEEILEILVAEIDALGLEIDVHIKDSEGISQSIAVGSRGLRITRDYLADQDEIRDIVAHEILTHALRAHKAKNANLSLLKYGTAGFIRSEEGLATIMGHKSKSNKSLVHPALLIIAIDTALQASFTETFDLMYSITGELDDAWTYTYRAKRGISDTSQKGAFTKDLYLQWAAQTGIEFLQNPKLIKTAFNGKASLEELSKYTDPESHDLLTLEEVKTVMTENKFL